jgi:DNA-binding NtrC family response regulator
MSRRGERKSILVVDDSPDTLEMLQRMLDAEGFRVFVASSVAEAVDLLSATPVDLVITDQKMPGTTGLDLVRHVRENLPDAEVMMITGYATVGGAVEAVKTGAEEYLAKPFTNTELLETIRRVFDKLHVRRLAAGGHAESAVGQSGLIGESDAMRQLFQAIDRASTSHATVLISGESGTGKELVARAIHYSSSRSGAPFVPVNCCAIPMELMESELFGHTRGSFTGARETRVGFFQTADGGTIFLDEVGETNPSMQVKLLRVLQDKEICMVGSRKPQTVNVRVIAATNKVLHAAVERGDFREDLFYRLHVLTIDIPPLRDRGDDVLLLARHYLDKFAREQDKQVPRFTDEVLSSLRGYDWPGNVREMENLIQRLVVMTDARVIDVADLPAHFRFSAPSGRGIRRTLAEVEIEHIRNVLASVGGNKTRAASILGIDRKTLREKLKQHERDRES